MSRLAIRFIEILMRIARSAMERAPMSQILRSATWRQIFVETVRSFLDELGYQITGARNGSTSGRGRSDSADCAKSDARQRLKTYSQLTPSAAASRHRAR